MAKIDNDDKILYDAEYSAEEPPEKPADLPGPIMAIVMVVALVIFSGAFIYVFGVALIKLCNFLVTGLP